MAHLPALPKLWIPKAADVVVDKLKDYLVTNQVKPGTRLPRERDLAQQLGVSRLTIREALRSLTSLGLVEVRRGNNGGIFTRNGVIDAVSESLMFVIDLEMFPPSDVMEMRLMVEPQAAALAAERHNERDMELLSSTIEQMERNVQDDEQYARYGEANSAFHVAVAEASHNLVIAMMMKTVGRVIFRNAEMLRSMKEVRLTTVQQHRDVLEAIERHNSAGAARAMRDHLKLAADMAQRYRALPRSPQAAKLVATIRERLDD